MPAYILVDIEVTDRPVFEEYRAKVPAVIAAYGGRYLARGGTVHPLEGEWDLNRVVILEFPDMEALKAFWSSPEYAPLLALREKSARSRIVAVEGYIP